METVEYRAVEKYDQLLFQRRELRQRTIYQECREIGSNRSETVATGSETFWSEWEDCQPGFVPPNLNSATPPVA